MARNSSATQAATVVHVLNGLAFGGNENLCLQLLHQAPPQVKNILISLDPNRSEMRSRFEQVPNLMILEQPYQGHNKAKFILSFAKTLKMLRPQAVLIYPFGVHIFVALAARLANVPQITVHVGNPVPNEVSMRRKWQAIVQCSRLLQTPLYPCSQTVQQSLQELTQLPKGSFPIPVGCDVEAISTQAKTSRKARSETSTLTIGMVARLNQIKDQATLIRAFRQVYAQFPDTQLWLIGDGDEKARLQNLIQDLNLQEVVILWGDRADIPQLLGQMDIYAFSTTADEGFGIALTEAMAASLPIVASDVPACREVLANGRAGLLTPQGDSVAMAQLLESLLLSSDQRAYWGQRAYQRVVNEYNIQKCAERWYRLLLNDFQLV